MSDYRVLVTGSRTWTDTVAVFTELGRIAIERHGQDMTVVHGAAKEGADAMAHTWATSNLGYGLRVTNDPHPAKWRNGRGAGNARNAEMVAAGADVCLAFVNQCHLVNPKCLTRGPHGTHGADHCAGLAEKAGIPVRRFGWQP